MHQRVALSLMAFVSLMIGGVGGYAYTNWIHASKIADLIGQVRWTRFLRQGHKVDRPMKRTIQHEDTQTVYGRVQGQGCA
jgi:hypothetical protein